MTNISTSSTDATGQPKVAIIGGGTAALSVLVALHRRGVSATLYSREANFAESNEQHDGDDADCASLRTKLINGCPPETIKWGHALSSAHILDNGTHELIFVNGATAVCELLIGAGNAPVSNYFIDLAEAEAEAEADTDGSPDAAPHSAPDFPQLGDVVEQLGRGTIFALHEFFAANMSASSPDESWFDAEPPFFTHSGRGVRGCHFGSGRGGFFGRGGTFGRGGPCGRGGRGGPFGRGPFGGRGAHFAPRKPGHHDVFGSGHGCRGGPFSGAGHHPFGHGHAPSGPGYPRGGSPPRAPPPFPPQSSGKFPGADGRPPFPPPFGPGAETSPADVHPPFPPPSFGPSGHGRPPCPHSFGPGTSGASPVDFHPPFPPPFFGHASIPPFPPHDSPTGPPPSQFMGGACGRPAEAGPTSDATSPTQSKTQESGGSRAESHSD
ncbi:hypothetical protein C8Q74DRAFT_1250121 [Fomes fomentarius]|nr:hypothetical protein C8Q74DRAFT_1250121 [Fomes fomentarius]